ncbi:Piwi-like protein 1, partial [Bulinus truncatus]
VWNIKIRDELQPLLISRPTERDVRRGDRSNLHLVPELCIITGLSNQMRADFVVMRDLAVQTRIDPTERLRQMQKLMDQLLASREVEAMIRPWNISFASEPCHIPARELPPEKLLVKNINNDYIKISYDAREADWSRGLQKASLLNAVNMDRWILICTKENDELAKSLSSSLFKVGRNMNMMINEPLWVKIIDDRNDTYIKAIKTCLKPDTQMVLCVVPNQKKDRYDAIKKCCCIDNPVPSQVVTSRTLSKSKALMSVAAKIAIQMNCKMGGEVWGAKIPLKGLMVVGIDAHHDSALKNKSVGALVASLNKEMTRYFSKTEYHPTKNELMENLQLLLRAALLKYKEVNGALPEKVIIYRDGVGDGQLKKLFHSEYDQAISAFRDAGGDGYRPQSAFIVVKKRILNRFFKPTDSAWTNPKPGTVVDQVVTKPEWYDFFIVSQSVRQGTVSPTSYNVIYDTTHLEPDQMQRLTYKLTHLYFNWQGTIRVPAPCQYAHKLAALQGQSLHKEFSNLLTDKLFYL